MSLVTMLRALRPGFVGLVLIMSGAALAEEDKVHNEFCPVMPDQPALPEHSVKYRGQTINFCCDPCRHKFLKDPQAYLKNLPQFETNPAALEEELETADSLLAGVDTGKTSRHLSIIFGVAAALLAVWWPIKWLLRWRGANPSVRPLLAEVGVCILVGALAATYFRAQSLDHQIHQGELKDLLHFATFHDFGDPPMPAKPPVPKRLQATFYRGNDERSPRLFNGGHYRTCTFHVSLCDREGRSLNYGDAVAGRGELCIKLAIERAPHTPDFFWEPDNMRRYFLTRQADPFIGSTGPIPDRVNLTTDEPLNRWSAVFPIGNVSPQGTPEGDSRSQVNLVRLGDQEKKGESDGNSLEGIIYVCEQFANEKQMVGARYHYAIQYALQSDNGHLCECSDLWMGALYRTRKVLQWRLPLKEWFSHEPIPVLPRAMAHDPKLLGISDYTGDSSNAPE